MTDEFPVFALHPKSVRRYRMTPIENDETTVTKADAWDHGYIAAVMALIPDGLSREERLLFVIQHFDIKSGDNPYRPVEEKA